MGGTGVTLREPPPSLTRLYDKTVGAISDHMTITIITTTTTTTRRYAHCSREGDASSCFLLGLCIIHPRICNSNLTPKSVPELGIVRVL